MTPKHNNACSGLPNGQPCPYGRRGDKDNVNFNVHMMDLCPDCSKFHDAEKNGVPLSSLPDPLPSDTTRSTRSKSQSAQVNDSENLIIDPVLCYVAASRDTSRKIDIAHMVAANFSEDLVYEAKTLLWQRVNSDVIGDCVKRQTTDKRSGKEANVIDIYDAMKKMEDKKCLPVIRRASHSDPPSAQGQTVRVTRVLGD